MYFSEEIADRKGKPFIGQRPICQSAVSEQTSVFGALEQKNVSGGVRDRTAL